MDGLLFAVVAVGGVLLVAALMGRSTPRRPRQPEPNPLADIAREVRNRNQIVAEEIAHLTGWILAMDINPAPALAAAEVLDSGQVRQTVETFLKHPLTVGLGSSTLMVHVAHHDGRIVLLAKLRPTRMAAVAQEFDRVSETEWYVRTRRVENFDDECRRLG